MPPECWEAWRGSPIASGQSRSSTRQRAIGGALGPDRRDDVLLDLAAAIVEADHLRHPVELLRRQPQGLAEVAHGAARAIGGEGSDQGRAVDSVAIVYAGDQHLADVAREVEVDVGHRRPDLLAHLLVEEAAGVEVVGDRVDVGESGEVTDDRADAGAAAAARRQDRASRVTTANLGGDLAGEQQQVVVEQEEAGEAEGADRLQLLLELGPRLGAVRRPGVALGQQGSAELGQLAIDIRLLGARVAITELAAEVELEPLGEPQGLGDSGGMLGEARRHFPGRAQGRAPVPPPQ